MEGVAHPGADDVRQRPTLGLVALLHDAAGVHLSVVLAAVAEHRDVEEIPRVLQSQPICQMRSKSRKRLVSKALEIRSNSSLLVKSSLSYCRGIALPPERDLVIREIFDVHIAVNRALGGW